MAFLGEDQTPANNGPNDLYSFIYGLAYELSGLAAQEFPLIGGRLDYLGGRTVAALVFQRNKHIINLFVWPAKEPDSKPRPVKPSQGYHLIHWTNGGMIFWVVSELNEKELMEFVLDFAAEKTVNP